jgi:integrase
MARNWQSHPDHRGVQMAHSTKCPASTGGRHRAETGCVPAYRKRVGARGEQRWITSKTLAEVLGATADSVKATNARSGQGRTFEDVGLEWWDLFSRGLIEKRRGAGPPSETTLSGYRTLLFRLPRGARVPTQAPLDPDVRGLIFKEWGHRPGDEITDRELQHWIDKLRTLDGRYPSRSRITEILAVIRGIYAYALRSTRRIWDCPNPTADLAIRPRGNERRLRVAQVLEARELLTALPHELALPYAIGFGTGLRRGEIARADWVEVHWKANKLHVPESKSEAGRDRDANISKLALGYLKAEFARQGFPTSGLIVQRSVFSGKLADAARKAWGWERVGKEWVAARPDALTPVTLQECRHTYASVLMAADYKVVEVMANMGQSDLAATQRYLKKLPQPNQLSEADRLHNYEDGFGEAEAV